MYNSILDNANFDVDKVPLDASKIHNMDIRVVDQIIMSQTGVLV